MSSQLPALNPTAYVGVGPLYPGNITFHNRDPDNLLDTNNFKPGDTWMCPTTNHIFMLMRDFNLPTGGKQADWVPITGGGGGGGIQNLKGDIGPVIGPIGGLSKILGDTAASGIQTQGILPDTIKISAVNADTAGQKGVSTFNPADFTVVAGLVSAIAGPTGTMKTLSGDNAAVLVPPDAGGNTKILGTAAQGIVTTGTIVSNQVQITASSATAAANIGLAQRGVSAFNSANFTVVGGFVSAIPPAGSFVWVAAPINATMAPNTGYYITGVGTVTLTLPAVAAAGTTLRVQGGAVGWKIAQQAGQYIGFDMVFQTTPGIGGSVASVDTFDGIELLCVQADTVWTALNIKGNPTIV